MTRDSLSSVRRVPIRPRALVAAAFVGTLTYPPRELLAQQESARTAPIQDNSFLLEEAYNQEARVVQHILTFTHARTGREMAFAFTQEWPAGGRKHQLSYTVPFVRPGDASKGRGGGVGDVGVNYRYQIAGVTGGPVAFAPRLTLLLPTGSPEAGTGAGGAGLQANLPLSVEISDRFVAHTNAGTTLTPRAHFNGGPSVRTAGYNVGQSLVWLAGSRVNALLEVAWTRTERLVGQRTTETETDLTVSPGVRWAFDFANGTQVVPGIAVPIGVGPSRGTESLFLYFSVEHDF